jgi:glycosyltransferase involved in cell wall biosynthesis
VYEVAKNVGIVVIARNEGERLRRCLLSIRSRAESIVYVDSGSTDGSVAYATMMGVEVLRLNNSQPFTMARARNAGFTHLLKMNSSIQFVQFIDGDCELEAAWIQAACAWMEMHPDTAVVCGRRREKFPRASVYNMLCDIEWNTPVGLAGACGGDALVRVDTFERVGMFDASLIAGEEPDLCARIRIAGGNIYRLPENMTRHDAAILTFSAWWRRMTRCGYGASEVVSKLRKTLPIGEVPFRRLTRSAVIWCDGWCIFVVMVGCLAFVTEHPETPGDWAHVIATAILIGMFAQAAQCVRTAWRSRSRGSMRDILIYAAFIQIAKWPQRLGQLLWKRDHWLQTPARLIEYKA